MYAGAFRQGLELDWKVSVVLVDEAVKQVLWEGECLISRRKVAPGHGKHFSAICFRLRGCLVYRLSLTVHTDLKNLSALSMSSSVHCRSK